MSAADPLQAPELEVVPISEERPIEPYSRRRHRRKRVVRSKTLNVARISKTQLELGRALYPEDEEVKRPKTRADCADVERPCAFVLCKHNLYLDVSPNGSIKFNFPDLEPHEMTTSCALDVADKDGATLEEVAEVMNMTRERVRQIEVVALAKVQNAIARLGLHALAEEGSERGTTKRRLPLLQSEQDEERDDGDAGDEDDAAFNVAEFASEQLDA